MTIAFLFIFGLIIGSALNAVIFRLASKKSFFRGRSECLSCQRQLKWYDLIPVLSFFILKKKCRYCGARISWQYPVVEMVCGLIAVSLGWYFGVSLVAGAYFVLSCFLLIIFVYDLKYQLILDKITIPAMVLAILANFIIQKSWLELGLGFIIGTGFFMFQYLISRGKWLGGGDIRLGGLMGLILGWKILLVALFIAYLVGALVALVLVVVKHKNMQSKLAFGTFLSAVTFFCIFYGQKIVDFYLLLII